jgi:hypothetical protein
MSILGNLAGQSGVAVSDTLGGERGSRGTGWRGDAFIFDGTGGAKEGEVVGVNEEGRVGTWVTVDDTAFDGKGGRSLWIGVETR